MNRPIKCIPAAFVFNGSKVPIAAGRFLLNHAIEPHNHEFVELVFVCSGHGLHRTASGENSLQRGDVFVFWPGTWHAFAACQQLSVYNCYFAVELLNHELAWLNAEPGLLAGLGASAHAHRSVPTERVLQTRMREAGLRQSQLFLEAMRHTPNHTSVSAHAQLVGHLILLLGQLAQTLSHDINPPESADQSVIHAAVAEGIRLMQSRLGYTWSLSELSGCLHVDRSYLVRLFSAHTGMSPMAYLAHQRALQAAHLLTSTDMPIAGIADAVGWSDPNYFARRFKAKFGISASTYRARKSSLSPPTQSALHPSYAD